MEHTVPGRVDRDISGLFAYLSRRDIVGPWENHPRGVTPNACMGRRSSGATVGGGFVLPSEGGYLTGGGFHAGRAAPGSAANSGIRGGPGRAGLPAAWMPPGVGVPSGDGGLDLLGIIASTRRISNNVTTPGYLANAASKFTSSSASAS